MSGQKSGEDGNGYTCDWPAWVHLGPAVWITGPRRAAVTVHAVQDGIPSRLSPGGDDVSHLQPGRRSSPERAVLDAQNKALGMQAALVRVRMRSQSGP